MTYFVDPFELFNGMASLYITAFVILGGLSMGGLSVGFFWNNCGCQAVHRIKERLAKWLRGHSRYVAIWYRLNRGVWG